MTRQEPKSVFSYFSVCIQNPITAASVCSEDVAKTEGLIGTSVKTEECTFLLRWPDLTGRKKMRGGQKKKLIAQEKLWPKRIHKLKQGYLTAKWTHLTPQDAQQL